MPAITLTWSAPYTPRSTTPFANAAWIQLLEWRRPPAPPGSLMPETGGLYVIENPAGQPIYAGQALDLRERFDGRTEVLREFGLAPLVANVVPNHTVRLASVNPKAQLSLAERWLVRRLKLTDNAAALHTLTNILLTGQFNAPNDGVGLQITNVANAVGAVVPPYFVANYVYAQGAAI